MNPFRLSFFALLASLVPLPCALVLATPLSAQESVRSSLPPYFSYALDPAVEHPRYAGDTSRYREDLESLRSRVGEEGLDLAIAFESLALEGDEPTREEADALTAARLRVMGGELWRAAQLEGRAAREEALAETAEFFVDLIGQPVPPAVAIPYNEALLEVGKASAADALTPEQLRAGIAAVSEAGNNPVSWLFLANVAFEMEDWAESNARTIALADVSLALNPGLIEAHVARWAAASVAEEFALAAEDGFWVLENAAQVAPEEWERVHKIHGQVVFNWLDQLTTAEHPNGELIDRVLRDFLAWYSPEGHSAFFAERLNRTRDRVGRARYLLWQEGLRPTDFTGVRRRLAQLVGEEDVENALKLANRFVRANSRASTALVVRAELFSSLGETDRALSDLDDALEMDSQNIDAAILRGSIHLERGDAMEAETALSEAIEVSPMNPVLRYMRANLRAQTEQFDEALIDLDMAVAYAAREEMGTVRFQRARVRAAAGDREGAAEDFVAAIESPQTDAEVAFEIGKMLEEWEMPQFARRCFRVSAEAGHPEATARLEALSEDAPQ